MKVRGDYYNVRLTRATMLHEILRKIFQLTEVIFHTCYEWFTRFKSDHQPIENDHLVLTNCRLSENVMKRLRSELLRHNTWFIHRDNAPTHSELSIVLCQK